MNIAGFECKFLKNGMLFCSGIAEDFEINKPLSEINSEDIKDFENHKLPIAVFSGNNHPMFYDLDNEYRKSMLISELIRNNIIGRDGRPIKIEKTR